MTYFKAYEADQFTFFRIPKSLFGGYYKKLSTDAKVLYGLLLDRMSLSQKNNWFDKDGRVFILFKREDIQEILGYKKDKVIALFKELKQADLIDENRQGLNRPNLIYVKKFIQSPETQRKSEKPNSGSRKNRGLEVGKTDSNDTDINDTEINEEIDSQTDELAQILNAIDFKLLNENRPAFQGELLEIELIITEMWSRRRIKIAGEYRSQEQIRTALRNLNSDHILYSLDCFQEASKQKYIQNTKAYLQSIIYQSVSEMHLAQTASFNQESTHP